MSALEIPSSMRAFWQARNASERRALVALDIVLAIAAVAQLAWMAWDESPRLAAEARVRRAELAHMQALARDLAQPASAAVRKAPAGAALLAAVSVEVAALPGALSAKPGAGGGVEIDGSGDFDAFVALLARLHATWGLRPVALEIGRAAMPGAVTVHAELTAE